MKFLAAVKSILLISYRCKEALKNEYTGGNAFILVKDSLRLFPMLMLQ